MDACSPYFPSTRQVQWTAGVVCALATIVAIAILSSQPAGISLAKLAGEKNFCVLWGVIGASFAIWAIASCYRYKEDLKGEEGSPKGAMPRTPPPPVVSSLASPTVVKVEPQPTPPPSSTASSPEPQPFPPTPLTSPPPLPPPPLVSTPALLSPPPLPTAASLLPPSATVLALLSPPPMQPHSFSFPLPPPPPPVVAVPSAPRVVVVVAPLSKPAPKAVVEYLPPPPPPPHVIVDTDQFILQCEELGKSVCAFLVEIDDIYCPPTFGRNDIPKKVEVVRKYFDEVAAFVRGKMAAHPHMVIDINYDGLFKVKKAHDINKKLLLVDPKLDDLFPREHLIQHIPVVDLADMVRAYVGPLSLRNKVSVILQKSLDITPQHKIAVIIERFRRSLSTLDPLAYVKEYAKGTFWLGMPTALISNRAKPVLEATRIFFEKLDFSAKEKQKFIDDCLKIVEELYDPITHAMEKSHFRYVLKAVLILRISNVLNILMKYNVKPDPHAMMREMQTEFDAAFVELKGLARKAEANGKPLAAFYAGIERYAAAFDNVMNRITSNATVCGPDILKSLNQNRPKALPVDPENFKGLIAPLHQYYQHMTQAEAVLPHLIAFRDEVFAQWFLYLKGKKTNFELHAHPELQDYVPDPASYFPMAIKQCYHTLLSELELLKEIAKMKNPRDISSYLEGAVVQLDTDETYYPGGLLFPLMRKKFPPNK